MQPNENFVKYFPEETIPDEQDKIKHLEAAASELDHTSSSSSVFRCETAAVFKRNKHIPYPIRNPCQI